MIKKLLKNMALTVAIGTAVIIWVITKNAVLMLWALVVYLMGLALFGRGGK